MIKNYLKTTFRSLLKNRSYSFLNIAGLGIGIACASLIFLWVQDELTYNHNFSKRDNIYTIYENQTYNGKISTFHATPGLMAKAIKTEIPGIKNAARMDGMGMQLFALGDKSINEQGNYADKEILSILDLPFVHGNSSNALDDLHTVVINETMAKKFFGEADPVGKVLKMNNDKNFTVTGVFKDLPKNSSLQFHWLVPLANIDRSQPWMTMWGANWARTYVELDPSVNVALVNQKLHSYISTKVDHNDNVCFLFAMNDWNLHDNFVDGKMSGGKIQYVRLFSFIAWIILLIACINFMNLSTARASRRAKEVGVRKIIGADNKGLILQFLIESCILSIAAVVIALPLLIIVLPWINEATGVEIPRIVFAKPAVWCLLLGVALLTGLLAGSYPAFYLSDFRAAKVLKGDYTSHISVAGLRRSLVVFQFVLSIVLIVGMMVIRQQLDFIRNKDLGFNKESQLVVTFHTRVSLKYANYFAMAIRQLPDVKVASLTDNYPGAQTYQTTRVYRNGMNPAAAASIKTLSSDEYFLKTMGIPLIGGRDFHFQDTGSVLINQSLARGLGLDPATAEGRSVFDWDGNRYTVAGVMKDFNYQSLHESVAPFMVVYRQGETAFDHLIINARSTRYSSLLSGMAAIWKQRVFVGELDARFLSDEIELLYNTEIIMSRIINSFTIMAIVISCLGLFGLAAFNAEQRTKEIGIRKVMGASVTGIVQLLSMDFLRLICISFLLGVPIAWWLMNTWLGIFVAHIQIPWWTFGIAGGATILAGMAVVGFQAAKAATVNPVESLRAV